MRREHVEENLCAHGAYILAPAESERQVTLDRLGLRGRDRLEAQQALLKDEGISAAVVSMPCWELFAQQTPALSGRGAGARHAAHRDRGGQAKFGWEAWLDGGGFVGMTGFGDSAPYKDLYASLGSRPRPWWRPSRSGFRALSNRRRRREGSMSLEETAKVTGGRRQGNPGRRREQRRPSRSAFDSIGVESTEENRRDYRSLLFSTTPGAGDYISGVILFDETIRQIAERRHAAGQDHRGGRHDPRHQGR